MLRSSPWTRRRGRWRGSPPAGRPAAYGSFVEAHFGGRRQAVGYDADSLGGWDVATGERLWRLVPERPNDFNVPTPLPLGDKLLVTTENNGTRLYGFDAAGRIAPKPLAINRRLAPDTHTPVASAGRLFGVWRRLFCLDPAAGLRVVWESDDAAFAGYGSAVADDRRLLVATLRGELILIDAAAPEYRELGRLRVLEGERGMYAHPAFVGGRAYLRGSSAVVCVELGR